MLSGISLANIAFKLVSRPSKIGNTLPLGLNILDLKLLNQYKNGGFRILQDSILLIIKAIFSWVAWRYVNSAIF
jgi:hypothetical protein